MWTVSDSAVVWTNSDSTIVPAHYISWRFQKFSDDSFRYSWYFPVFLVFPGIISVLLLTLSYIGVFRH